MHGMRGMRYIEAVRAQGKNLRSSRAAVADQLKGLDLAPWRGRRLGLVGMGASANAIGAALGAYWAAGLPATAWLGSELGYAGAAGNFDAVIAVSQSGKSTEIVAALNGPVSGYPKLVVTDGPDAPAARLADATVGLALLEDSNVRTIGYTGTLQALFLLADALAGPGQGPAADWDWLADEMDRQLPAAERLAADLLGGAERRPVVRRGRGRGAGGHGRAGRAAAAGGRQAARVGLRDLPVPARADRGGRAGPGPADHRRSPRGPAGGVAGRHGRARSC